MAEHLPPAHPGYEVSDVSTPPIWKFLGYLFVITFASIGLMYAMFLGLKSYTASEDKASEPTMMQEQRTLPTGTRLQVNEPQDLKTYRAKEAKANNTYSWEDKTVKVVRIPVSRAMEIVAEKGLPKFEVTAAKPGAVAAAKPAAPAKQTK